QMLRAGQSARRIFEFPGTAIAVGVRRHMHAGGEGALVVAVAAAEKSDRACGLAVVTAPEPDEFEFFCHRFGETKSGLDRLGAAREQLDMRDAVGQQFGDQIEKTRTRLGREAAEGEALELFIEAFEIMRVTMPHAPDRDAGDEIEIL